jgi:hypothetical protein
VAEAVDQEDNLDTLGKILPAVLAQPHHLMVENMAVVVEAEEAMVGEAVMAVTE